MKSCILITGSRSETDYERIRLGFKLAASIIRRELGIQIGIQSPPLLVVHGAARGADSTAESFARGFEGIQTRAFPADWNKHGKGAGPIRNQQMVDYVQSIREEYFPVCLAFPKDDSIGTWDCVKRAQKAGIVVVVCP